MEGDGARRAQRSSAAVASARIHEIEVSTVQIRLSLGHSTASLTRCAPTCGLLGHAGRARCAAGGREAGEWR
eukprot:scaffold2739_cov257-Pinguiococcus_pyrenoidosus.AAC.20